METFANENAVGQTGRTDPKFVLQLNNFQGVFQYESNFEEEWKCYRDGVAPQVAINATQNVPNVFIPTTDEYKWMREFNEAHYIANYGWIFTEPSIPKLQKLKKEILKE